MFTCYDPPPPTPSPIMSRGTVPEQLARECSLCLFLLVLSFFEQMRQLFYIELLNCYC